MEQTINQRMQECMNRSINPTITPSTNESINQRINESIDGHKSWKMELVRISRMDVTNLRRIGPPITAQSIPSHFTRREKGIRRAAQFSRSSLNQVKSPRRSHISELFLHRRHIKRIVACVHRCQSETFRVQFHLTLHDRQPCNLMVRKRTSGNSGSKMAIRIAPKVLLACGTALPESPSLRHTTRRRTERHRGPSRTWRMSEDSGRESAPCQTSKYALPNPWNKYKIKSNGKKYKTKKTKEKIQTEKSQNEKFKDEI